jgi:serine/threonine protein kinase
MAEQEQPVRRRVALKIIKLGMDTRNVIARFEAERQALAMMDHPNIAKVLDAGATPTGRPYFVMELVRGVKITSYCDQQKLSTRQRLDLFIAVCQAIQHAHQKGVIHRDIKPSNVLVTEQDGAPMPKIIDFGIAKATTDQRLTDKTLFTAFEQFIGTPAYMSPEQAGLGGLDIDTRSDIYSLGVLLYELLTSHPPFDLEELRRSALDEILRVIRENEPPRPSARLTTLTEQELTTVAQRRQIESAKLPKLLRGDLDWIVMKALENDRTRRYETANGFATDLQRHLNNEPVVARPPSNLYRFQKLIRRNKLAFTAAGAVTLALLLGLGISTWSLLKERQARQHADTEAKKSKEVAQFLKDMLEGVGPSAALGRDTKMLQEILDMTAKRIGKALPSQPEVEAELRGTMGGVYQALGDYGKAESMERASLAMARKAFGNEHRNVATALIYLGYILYIEGKLAEAETVAREGLAMQRKLRVATADYRGGLNTLALILSSGGKPTEAELLYREALPLSEHEAGNRQRASVLGNLADLFRRQGKLAEAEMMNRESLTLFRKLLGNEHPSVAHALHNLASTLELENKLAEAEKINREALALERKLLGNEHPDVASSLHNLALVLHREGNHAEAEILMREGLLLQRKLLGDGHPEVAKALQVLASILREEGKFAETQALDREWLQNLRKRLPADDDYLIAALAQTSMCWVAEGLFTEVEPLARECLTLREKKMPDDWRTFNSRSMLGGSLLGQKKCTEAEPLLLSGGEGLEQREDKIPASGKYNLKYAFQRLVQLYEVTGRPDQAAEWKQKLAELQKTEK